MNCCKNEPAEDKVEVTAPDAVEEVDTSTAKFTVNDECIGCGYCTGVCPKVFRLMNGKSVAIDGFAPADALDAAYDAMENCPVEAISQI